LQYCNRIAQLTDSQMDAKGAAAKAATAAVLEATSDCYKAAEIIHSAQAPERAAVYLASAGAKVDLADAALKRNREILGRAPVRPEALQWLRELDYDRLYRDGVDRKLIPANDMQWSALVRINQEDGYLGVADNTSLGLSRHS
jgi:hypothetical protein